MNEPNSLKIPIVEIIPLLKAIGDRNRRECAVQEEVMAEKYGVNTWEKIFYNQVIPTTSRLDREWIFSNL
ncbi:MAG: hypothetical protein ACKOQ2_00710 [Dolichospermum sp.]